MDTKDIDTFIKNKLRSLVAEKGYTVSSAAEKAGFDGRGINNKLNRGTLRISEYMQILKTLGYDIQYINKDIR